MAVTSMLPLRRAGPIAGAWDVQRLFNLDLKQHVIGMFMAPPIILTLLHGSHNSKFTIFAVLLAEIDAISAIFVVVLRMIIAVFLIVISLLVMIIGPHRYRGDEGGGDEKSGQNRSVTHFPNLLVMLEGT